MKRDAVLFLTLFAVFSANGLSQVSEKDSVIQTAKSQISLFIKDLPDGSLSDYGFLNREEFGKVDFGPPIPVYTLKDSVVVFTSTWRVPVVIGMEYRSLLTVIKENDTFRAVDFGAAELAKAYQTGKTPKTIGLLRVYEIKSDFLIERSVDGNQSFMPIKFNR